MIGRFLALLAGKPLAARSPKWPAARAAWLRLNGECEVCGSKTGLNVHHKRPYHLWPELELDPANFITLCETNGCHFLVGHGRDWKAYNEQVVSDAKLLRSMIRNRRYKRAK